jgi:phosphatidylglycerophosphate synthase
MNPDLEKMRRPSDSLLTSILARSISFRLTPLIAKTPITPLQITLMGLFLGLMAAWQASRPGWTNLMLAALLLELSHVLDCVDGELARLTDRGNPFAAALDPITDRIKDMMIIFAAYIQSSRAFIFTWSEHTIFVITFFTIGFWTFYMYIVDAYLNPSRKNRGYTKTKIYIGLYDLFVYGAIGFLVTGLFEYFNLYILLLAAVGVSIQIVRLNKILH